MAARHADPPNAHVDDDDGTEASFGETLRQLRRQAGLSLTDLANRVHYSKTQISRVENGRLPPSLTLAKACERELGAEGTLASLIPPRRRRSTWSASAAIDLPNSTVVFLGRDQELDQIQSLVAAAMPRQSADAEAVQRPTCRVVVVWGLPGVGKTELIVQAAERLIDRCPDGCLYLDLRGATDPIDTFDAMGRLLRRLGIAPDVVPTDPGERSALYRRVLRGRRVLLVLDNPQNAAGVAALSAPGRESITLVASRRRLDALDEAYHLHLEPLEVEDARRLVEVLAGDELDLIGAYQGDLLNAALAACGYLPLALRIVAARLRTTAWKVVADRAAAADPAEQLSMLHDGERNIARTFLAAFSVLPTEESHLLALLTILPGVTVDDRGAAVLVADTTPAVLGTLHGLVAAGLATPIASSRYALHDLVRAVATLHARATLSDADAADARTRVIDGYLAMAQQADLTVTPDRHRPPSVRPGPPRWPASFHDPGQARGWFDAEQDNLVGVCELAATSGRDDACWRLAYAMRDHFFRTKAVHPWIHTHELALASARSDGDGWAVAVTLNNLGLAHAHLNRHDLAAGHYAQALDLFREIDDQLGVATTLGHRAWIAHAVGDHAAAIAYASEALGLYREHGARRHVGITLRTLGLAELALGRTRSATARFREAQQIFEESGLAFDEAMALNCLGEAARAGADPDAARSFHTRAWWRARACDSRTEQARALRGLAAVAEASGRQLSSARLNASAARLTGGLDDLS